MLMILCNVDLASYIILCTLTVNDNVCLPYDIACKQ